MKYLIVVIIVLVVIGGGGWLWYSHAEAAAAASAGSALQTAKVERKDLRVSVQSQGAVASNRDVDIKCKASGNIKELPYKDVSASVAPGALLMQLDTDDQQRALDSANAVVDADNAKLKEAELNKTIAQMNLETTRMKDEADLASAKAKANDARAKSARTKELFENKLAAAEDLETAETAAAQADAAVKQAEAAISELDQQKIQIDTREEQIKEIKAQRDQDIAKQKTAIQNRDYCTVTAPLPVTEAEKADPPRWFISKMTAGVAVGYLVQSGSSGSSGGTTVMTLADMSHVFVLATVSESDIGNLLVRFENGQDLQVRITADAFQGIEFTGKVVRIAEIGVSTSNVVTFEVKIEVTSENRRLLRPIMTTNVEIISAERKDALTIPVQAFSKKRPESTNENATASAPAVTEVAPAAEAAPADATPSEGGRKRGGGGRHKRDQGNAIPLNDKPQAGSVTVQLANGSTEQRDVVVGVSDGASYEVISGLDEGDTVVLNKMGADSKWRGNKPGGGNPMRGFGR